MHVLELKKHQTAREVVAQALDYGSWAATLSNTEVREIAEGYLKRPLESAFVETFGGSLPDELKSNLSLTLAAAALDASSERIGEYLRSLDVPINAVFFTHLEDEVRRYLARSWMAGPVEARASSAASARKQAAWNGRDWFFSFGEGSGSRAWVDAQRYSFVSDGGGAWYSGSLGAVEPGAG